MFQTLTLPLASEDDTDRLGADLAKTLRPGTAVLLHGPVGAGKSHLSRAFIRAALGRMEDVPSPTFTLVQVYDTETHQIWHADLYRLSHPDEVMELGLDMAMEEAICLIEWPDRLGDLAPADALHIRLEVEGDARVAVLSTVRTGLLADLRKVQAGDMLERAGWADARAERLAGDASARSYQRLHGNGTAILMDTPPRTGDDPADFVAIAQHLAGLGLSPPRIIAQDLPHGFLLLEDLGDGLFARLLEHEPEAPLYAAATDVLRHIQAHPAPPGLPDMTARDWAEAIRPVFDWYAPGTDPAPLTDALHDAILRHADDPRVLILRDYHAENLLWLPDREGLARVGLLDFQLGQMGQRGYDLVSLLQDARRDVSLETEAAMIARFDPSEAFRAAYAVLGTQRGLRILGIFARLAAQGKPSYLALIPRVWEQVQRNLAHPALGAVSAAMNLPSPEKPPLMLFAAGLGTRMGALTQSRPKPLIEVAGKPLIDHALDIAHAAGVRRIVANTHYLADQIAAHLPDTPLSHEPELLETGGGLRAALPLLGKGAVMTLNTDAVWTGANPISRLLAAWDPARMDGLLLLLPAANATGHRGTGDFLIDNGQLSRANGAPGLVYLGVQIIKPEGLMVVEQQKFSLNILWDRMIAEGRLFGTLHDGGWCDVGRPESIPLAEALLHG